MYCPENPAIDSCAALQEFLLKNITDRSSLPYFLTATKDQQGDMSPPWQRILLCNLPWISGLLKLRLTWNHTPQRNKVFSSWRVRANECKTEWGILLIKYLFFYTNYIIIIILQSYCYYVPQIALSGEKLKFLRKKMIKISVIQVILSLYS